MTKTHDVMSPASVAADFDASRWELVPCAFCHGEGTDPFNLPSERSTCESCHGRGTVLVPTPHVRCIYCDGSGSDKTFRCPVCRGAGEVSAVPEPNVTCAECDGHGSVISSGLECLNCRGRGLVPTAVPGS